MDQVFGHDLCWSVGQVIFKHRSVAPPPATHHNESPKAFAATGVHFDAGSWRFRHRRFPGWSQETQRNLRFWRLMDDLCQMCGIIYLKLGFRMCFDVFRTCFKGIMGYWNAWDIEIVGIMGRQWLHGAPWYDSWVGQNHYLDNIVDGFSNFHIFHGLVWKLQEKPISHEKSNGVFEIFASTKLGRPPGHGQSIVLLHPFTVDSGKPSWICRSAWSLNRLSH